MAFFTSVGDAFNERTYTAYEVSYLPVVCILYTYVPTIQKKSKYDEKSKQIHNLSQHLFKLFVAPACKFRSA